MATLVPDRGAGASDRGHFFRSPEFLEAEGVTHTLTIEGKGPELRLPVIVRPIEGSDGLDAISPYGYPGGSELPDPPPDPASIDWSSTALVSLFVRDRIADGETLAGGTVRSEVHIAGGDGSIRKRLREQIRRNERRGWKVTAAPGPEAAASAREGFERAYAETMARTEAAERYLYPSEYFERLLASRRSWLLLAHNDERSPEQVAGALAVASDSHLHYYLGGTADGALDDSPMKNVFAGMISLAGGLGLPLNLGGGVRPGDSLDSFKRGFANATAAFRTHEVICDRSAYDALASRAGPAPEGFFPAYRA